MTPADVDALLVHEPFVRAIARALLRGDSRVDDVVQETWLAAMQSGPNDPTAARGWLAAVVRNVVRSLLRKDAVRKKHTPPGKDPLPSAASIAAQEEIRREVLDELLALDEPYRTALLLRYYEDLPPREISKRLEIPVETARTRVKRGLNLLRGRLDKKNGGRREAWAVALVPLALRSATAATSGAVLAHLLAALKGAHVVAAVGVVAIVGAGYLGWKSFSSGDANTPARTSERVATAPPVQDEEPAVEPAPADAVTISGIVTGPAGKPHGAATVEALPYLDMGDLRGWDHLARLRTLPRPRVVARTTADAGGRFVFAVPRGRRLVLRARDAEHFGLPLHSLDVGRDVVGVRLRLTPKGVLEGVVVSEEGTPIAGATLFAMPNRGNWSAAEVLRVVTDLEGSFSFGQLPAGPQDLLLSHPEFAPVRLHRLSGEGLRLVMSSGLPIEGTVRHQETGRPVEGAIVTVIPALTETPAFARTDSEGRYRIEHAGVSRTFRFVLAADGFGAGYRVLSERIWSPGDQFDIDIGPTRTLRGRTVTKDEQGHVVPAAGVRLRIATYAWWTSGISYGGPKGAQEVVTDSQGRFALDGVSTKESYLQVAPDDMNWSMASVKNSAFGPDPNKVPGDRNDIEVAVGRRRDIEGLVVDHDDKPVPEALVYVTSLRGRYCAGAVYTDANGRYLLRHVDSGPYAGLRAEAPGSGRITVQGIDHPILKLKPEIPRHGRVTNPAGDPVADVWVGTKRHPRGLIYTDADGRWSLPVFDQRAVLHFSKPGYAFGSAKDGDLVLQPLARVTGMVRDPNQAPIAGVAIYFRTGDRPRNTTTAADGRFTIVLPPSGELFLSAQKLGYAARVESLELPLPEPLSITMQPERVIRGTALDLSGRPLPRARIDARGASQARSFTLTDRHGAFALYGLGPGRYILRARHSKADFDELADIEAGTQGVALQAVQTTVVVGRIVWPPGVEPTKIQVHLYREDHKLRAQYHAHRYYTDGRFEFKRLVGERLTIWAQHPTLASMPLTVTAGSSDVELELVKGLTITGTVTGADETESIDVAANAADLRGEGRNARADKNGRFELRGLAPGRRYNLMAYSRTRGLRGRKKDIEAGASGVSLTLKATGKKRGKRGK